MPQNAAITIELKFSNLNLTRINIELIIMSVMQMPTQMHSCVLFPVIKIYNKINHIKIYITITYYYYILIKTIIIIL